jgi:CheY-like chemotaxis protein
LKAITGWFGLKASQAKVRHSSYCCRHCDAASPLLRRVHPKSALSYLLHQPLTDLPGCIFLDLNMPGMDGRECLQRIKSVPRLKDIPVIMFSTSVKPEDAVTYAALGAQESVLKPYTYGGILKTMKDLMGRTVL